MCNTISVHDEAVCMVKIKGTEILSLKILMHTHSYVNNRKPNFQIHKVHIELLDSCACICVVLCWL